MRKIYSMLVAGVALACAAEASPKEVLVGGPCEGCENVFVDRPAKLVSSARIAPANEPGEALVIEGIVRDAAKQPVANVIVYAYHTNAKGDYPKGTTRHGALRGFARTGKDGKYRFDTIRPASYPNTPFPQHVHVHVIEVGKCHYVIDDIVFTDDPRLTAEQRKAHERGVGGVGVATPTRKAKTWHVRRNITLGANIRDYKRCR